MILQCNPTVPAHSALFHFCFWLIFLAVAFVSEYHLFSDYSILIEFLMAATSWNSEGTDSDFWSSLFFPHV